MHLLSADTTMFEKNLAHQKLKKMAHNGPQFFFNTSLAAQTAQKQKFRTT